MASAIKLSSDSPQFTVTAVLEKQLLNYASLGENSNKFYYLELQRGTGDYPYRVYTEYGRVGKTKNQEGRYFRSLHEAENAFYDLKLQKGRKGYVEVTLESQMPSVTSIKPQVDLSFIESKVHQLIGKFYHEAIGFVTAAIETPLGKISALQVRRGTDILNEIERSINHHTWDLEALSNQFYCTIPVIFGQRVDRNKMIIDSYEKVLEKREMLDVMTSIVVSNEKLQSTIEEKYVALNLDIQLASKKEATRVTENILKSQSLNHYFKIDVLDVFKVVSMAGHDTFNPYKVSTMELYHGSRNCNMLGIMQSGLKVKPSAAVHTGSMFGAGIYFASQSTKSANYCWGFNSARPVDSNFLLVCEVATGKVKEYEDAQYHLCSAPKGYNSVMGKKGNSLIHDEYIVYHPNQARIKYIVEFQRA